MEHRYQLRKHISTPLQPIIVHWKAYPLVSSARVRHPLDSEKLFVRVSQLYIYTSHKCIFTSLTSEVYIYISHTHTCSDVSPLWLTSLLYSHLHMSYMYQCISVNTVATSDTPIRNTLQLEIPIAVCSAWDMRPRHDSLHTNETWLTSYETWLTSFSYSV